MSKTLRKINQFVSDARPSDYDHVSYNTYFKRLTEISNTYLEEKEELKREILKIEDETLRLKLLELI